MAEGRLLPTTNLDLVRSIYAAWGRDQVKTVRPSVICDTRRYGVGRESGVAIDVHLADACELSDGKVTRVTLGYDSPDEAFRAAERRR